MRVIAICFCCSVILSGCSPDQVLNRLMGNKATQNTSESLEIVDDENSLTVDSSLEKPQFSMNPAESATYEANSEADPLQVEAFVSGEGTISYQWYKNNVNSNGGGTVIEGATKGLYTPDTQEEGTVYYYAVATNHVGNSVSMTTSTVAEITIVPAGQWITDDHGTWYQKYDGSYPSSKWEKLNGKWYAFDENGYVRTGWFKSKEIWYYLDEDGAMQTGWLTLGEKQYYLNEDGAMQTGWYQEGETWYYFDADGAMKTGWIHVGNEWYYMDEDGAMQTDWVQVDGAWYYLNPENGKMAHDTTVDGYQIDSNGKRIS